MLYSELIAEIADRTEMTNKDVKAVVASFVEVITNCAQRGEDVTVSGIGTFKTGKVAERITINPKAPSEKITVPAHKTFRLSVSRTMKKAIN